MVVLQESKVALGGAHSSPIWVQSCHLLLVAGQRDGSPICSVGHPSTVHLLMLQGSKVDLQGARSTSSSLGDSPAMRLGVGVHPTGPARSIDLVPRGEPSIMACLDLAWLAAARCLYKARRPTCGREGVSPAHSAVRYALPRIIQAGSATRGLWRQGFF